MGTDEPSGALYHLQRAGIFGGVVLIPVVFSIQFFDIFALIICIVGFAIYTTGLAVFGRPQVIQWRPEFAKAGRLVCTVAYLMATISATSSALSMSARTELQNRFLQAVTTQLESAFDKPGKSTKIAVAESSEELKKTSPFVGQFDAKEGVRVTSISTVTQPILNSMLEKVETFLLILFCGTLFVAACSVLIAVFVLPLVVTPPIGKTTPGGGAS